MAYNSSTFTIRDLGAGIDQQSAENSLREGYSELLLNADPEAMGYLTKRVGYERAYGQLPVRISKVEYSTGAVDNLCFFLDSEVDISSIDLLNTRRTPLVIQGRTSPQNTLNEGDFPNDSDSASYYPTFNADVESVFAEGSNSLASAGLGTEHVFVHTAKRDNLVDKSNSVFIADEVRIDTTTGAVTVSYDNNTGSSFEGYIYLSDKTPTPGTTYRRGTSETISGAQEVDANNVPTATPPADVTEIQEGRWQYVVPTTQHSLSNFNIDTRIYRIDGTDYVEVRPDRVEIAQNGDVTFTIQNQTGSTFEAVFYLTAYPVANSVSDTVLPAATSTIELTGLTTPFIGLVTYLDDDPASAANPIRQVIPNSVTVDDVSKTATIEFINQSATSKRFTIYWESVNITSNKLCVTASEVTSSFTDTEPQLTIWGLDHETIYGPAAQSTRPGWATHLDSYKSEGENRLVAGLGGNFFTESQDVSAYLLPTLYPNLNGRCAADTNIGPTFYEDGAQSGLPIADRRSRGWIESVDAVGNFLPITSITWVSGNSVTYTFDNISYSALPSTLISTTPNLEDFLTVKNSPQSRHNGTFRITQVTQSGSSMSITVDNPQINCPNFNSTASTGLAGIFTDQVTLLQTSQFQSGDELASDLFTFDTNYEVVNSSGSVVAFEGVSAPQLVPAGLLLVARRTTNILPLRKIDGTPSTESLVAFDSITYTDIQRKLTAKFLNTRDDEVVSITGDGTTATVTLDTSSNINYAIGQTILLNQASTYTGAQVITAITDAKEIQFASTSTESTTGTLVGHTVEFDEVLQIRDSVDNSVTLSVDTRWVPIEAPLDNFTKTRKTYTQHLDTFAYSEQPYVKSTMVSDNLYLTNGADEVMKYDGVNLYRAGLFRWQPQLFITVNPDAADGNIQVPSLVTSKVFTSDGNEIELADGEETKWSAGDIIVDDAGTEYTIRSATRREDAGSFSGILELNKTYTGTATGSTFIKQVGTYSYYFRLNAIDANNNRVGSALTGISDTRVKVSEPSQIRIRLVGLPAWDIYDYDRLEVEIYRSQLDQATYRRVVTLPMSFNDGEAYLDFADDTNDDLLLNVDPLQDVLTGGVGTGTQFSEPLRANYMTSAGNRLVLANLVDYPELSIRYESNNLSIADLTAGTPKYIFRRDNTDISSTSDLETRQAYEFVSSGALTVSDISNTVDFTSGNVSSATDEITITNHTFKQNDQIELSTVGTLPSGLLTSTTYFVQVVDINTIQLSLTSSGTPVDLLDSGSGTHTITWLNEARQFTVTTTGSHGLDAGDWVYHYHFANTGNNSLQYAGWFRVAERISGTSYKCIHTHTSPAYTPANEVDRIISATDKSDIPVFLGVDANYAQSSYNPDGTSANFDYTEVALVRLANAINVSMREADDPWMIAGAGGDFGVGQLVIRQPKVEPTFLEVQVPAYSTSTYRIFINSVARASEAQASARIQFYPSRLVFSENNFPEIFLNPRAVSDIEENTYVVDVNAADGEQITGVIPFFGDSAFGAAQKDGVLVVFKESSIYLVNLEQAASGLPAVQRLESQGLGCTAPRSIAVTRDGIMFANRSGMYKLTRDLRIEYVGQKVERLWQEEVNLSRLDEAVGHHYSVGQRYKLSYPQAGASENSKVFTYNHTREYEQNGPGSWTTYDNHPATWWANLLTEAYFSTTAGAVMRIRNSGNTSDFRDDDEPINMEATLRALDFGDAGIRKVLQSVIAHFRNLADMSGTQLSSAIDLDSNFADLDEFEIVGQTDKIVSLKFSVGRRKGVYFQLKIGNSAKDEPVEITSLDIRVAGLNSSGIRDAASTRKS